MTGLLRRAARIAAVVAVAAASAYAVRGTLVRMILRPAPPPAQLRGVAAADLPPGAIHVVADKLETPWAFAFPPEGGLLVTERPGRLVHVVNGERRVETAVPGVRETGEGGLMGVALDPRFADNRLLYLMFTTEGAAGLENRVMRYRWTGAALEDARVLLGGIPAAVFHNGGRLAFGPDGYLYATAGDAADGSRAQQPTSLAGKILRITGDGLAAPGNPYGTVVYSLGHRNPQGLAWDDRGRLWSTEHGRSGTRTGLDELNVIEAGKNYGWPLIEGDDERRGMEPPVLHSGPEYTWAPAGAAYLDGSLFFGGLRGEALYEARLHERGVAELRVHFYGDFGRIRAVAVGPDGMLYFSTSNRDQRGRPRPGDDRIVRLDWRHLRRR